MTTLLRDPFIAMPEPGAQPKLINRDRTCKVRLVSGTSGSNAARRGGNQNNLILDVNARPPSGDGLEVITASL
jgi:hypothetical protein